MAQEEHTQRYSSSSGGDGGGGSSSSRSSKKLKEKKVPQRGLGVAQLEKIRLEEQQKKDGSISSPISFPSPSNSSQNFRHNPSPSLVPFPPPPLPTDLSTPNSLFRQDSSIPNIDFLHPLHPRPDGDGGEIGWPSIPGLGQGYLPKFWNGDHYDLEGENHGLAFRSNVKLPFESKSIWAPPVVIQRGHKIQQQPPSTSLSMVNVSSGTSSLSQMEPPSNQSFYGKNNTPMWSEEEKMVGRKRSYPFSPENIPGLSFPCKVPSAFVQPTNRSNEPSGGNGSTVNVELSNPSFSNLFREGSSSSTVLPELNPKKATKENEDLNEDFLTLAPPTTAVPRPSSKSKHPSMFLNPHRQELPDFESLPFQGKVASPFHLPRLGGSTQQQPFYSFYPPAKARISPVTTTVSGCSSVVGENLDLNLKL
ncbi:hypothetical protein Vadar_003615 [Vaccinium darrowii]|uniref:Uncharacterized protein n=1 Tax=Vaccinium darrowii TaxID=229202 RepID=A0ACB7Z2Y0_9ERIC|nr:hypothetical protein Vadar_003615 [Vaccinium darrowii]